MSETLKDAVEVTVELLYDKMLNDTNLSKFFKDADMERLKRKQEWFLESVLNSEAEGAAEYVQESHGRLVDELDLNESHFSLMVSHMQSAMNEAGLSTTAQDKLMVAIGRLKEPLLMGKGH